MGNPTMIILMGLVLLKTMEMDSHMKKEPMISSFIVMHLHLIHKVTMCHQIPLNNPPPACTPGILLLHQLTIRLLHSCSFHHQH